MDTCFNYCDPDWAYMSSDDRHWIARLRRLARERPGECVITCQPETNGGIICAKFPPKWLFIGPPRQINMSEEKRAEMAARLRRNLGLEEKNGEE